MSQTIEAVYENGVFKPRVPPELAEGTAVRLTVAPAVDDDPLADVIGICDTGPPVSLAERHDEFIYGVKPAGEQPS